MFNVVHSLSHPGRKPSQRLVASKFIWHGLKKDARTWADTSIVYQSCKMQCHIKAALVQFPVPERRFDHVKVDCLVQSLLWDSLTSLPWWTGPPAGWRLCR